MTVLGRDCEGDRCVVKRTCVRKKGGGWNGGLPFDGVWKEFGNEAFVVGSDSVDIDWLISL